MAKDEVLDPGKAPEFKLTPKEELAVIVQRLNAHEKECENKEAKIRLSVAQNLVQASIFWR